MREQRQTILIVDDVVENISILGEALQADYDIRFATNGKDALSIAGSEPSLDLILLDIMMPGLDGFEICARLKRDEQTHHIPVIFLTAREQEHDETKGLELGAADYIKKPFNLPIIKARVRTQLELKRKTDLLESLAHVDGLTCIPNRRRFDDLLDQEWRRALRSSSWLSLIMIDIDYFKDFNDNLGHGAGDNCLKRVAKRLSESLSRAGDVVARYGGEEFVALLPGSDSRSAVQVAEHLRRVVTDLDIPHPSSPVSHVTISLGVASIVPKDTSPEELLKAADEALYRSKAGGRNRSQTTDLSEPLER